MNDRHLKLKDAIEVVRETVADEYIESTLELRLLDKSLTADVRENVQLDVCPLYGGACGYPSGECYDCPRHGNFRENVKGEWLPHPNKSFREWDVCSACGIGCKRREYGIHANGDKWVTEYSFNFCPNCGADMRGDKS